LPLRISDHTGAVLPLDHSDAKRTHDLAKASMAHRPTSIRRERVGAGRGAPLACCARTSRWQLCLTRSGHKRRLSDRWRRRLKRAGCRERTWRITLRQTARAGTVHRPGYAHIIVRRRLVGRPRRRPSADEVCERLCVLEGAARGDDSVAMGARLALITP
jgi:hypothetical protein